MTTRYLLLCAMMAFPGSIAAQSIAVVNPDFESPVQPPNGFTNGVASGWSAVAGTGDWGVFYPTVATWGYVTSLNHQLLYTNGSTIEQTLTTNAQVGSYTLRIDVINRPTFGGHNYFIELYAGTTLLARDGNTLSPPVGGYLTSTLVATLGPGSPGVGQAFRIRLGGLNQTNFDNVRLTVGACYPNCDGSTTPPVLNVLDFSCFLNKFSAGDPFANCDGSTTPPVLNVLDFSCFLNRFSAGCS